MSKLYKKCTKETVLHKEDWRSWQSVVFVFIVNCFLGMNYVTFSVLYIYMTEYFESDKATIGWIGSIQKGTTFTLGEC